MIRRLLQWWREGPGRGDVLGMNRRNLDLVFADYRPGKFRELDDKLAGKEALGRAGVPVPRTLGVIAGPEDLPRLDDLLATEESLVIKPAKGWGGRGILVLAKRDGRWRRPGGAPVDTAALHDHVADILAGVHSLDEDADAAVVEERIVPHPFYAELGPTGLCDLRVVLDRRVPVQAMCRVPTVASDGKANLHGGGVGLGIDLATGTVTGAVAGGRRVTRHPDTGRELAGLRLPDWERCLEVAAAAAGSVAVDYIGVDIVVDARRGPLVLEVNARPGLAIQIANAAAQPVRTRARETAADLFTQRVNWLLLLLLAASPLVFQWWQDRNAGQLVVAVGAAGASAAMAVDSRDDADLDADGTVLPFEELAIAASDSVFAAARSAAAAGDTAAAVTLYRSVLADSARAPFALNNLALLARRAGNDSLALACLQEAVDRFPSYHRGYYNLGLALEAAGRREEARDAYVKALAVKPNHAGAWTALGSLRFGDRDYAGAAEAFGNAIRFDPAATAARLKLGLANRLLGNLPAARTDLEELLALEPDNEPAAYWLARTGGELARMAGGEAAADLARWRAVVAPFTDRSTRCRSLDGELAYAAGDLPAALARFSELARTRYRTDHHALASALVALELGLWRRAEAAARPVADDERAAAVRLRALAEIGRALVDGDAAAPDPSALADPVARLAAAAAAGDRRAVERVLQELAGTRADAELAWPRWLAAGTGDAGLRIPGDVLLHCAAGRDLAADLGPEAPLPPGVALQFGLSMARRRGAADTAARFLAALRQRQPASLPVLEEDFARALAAGAADSARARGDRIVGLGAGDPLLTLTLAELHRGQGDAASARALLESLPPAQRTTPPALILEGRLELADGRPKRAARLLGRAAEGDPANADAHFALGQALFALQRLREAEAQLRQALDLDPGRADVRRILASQLMHRKQYAAAAREWTVLVALDEGDLSARFNLALSLQRDGDDAAALANYDALLAVQPDRTSAVFNRALALERLGRTAEAAAGFRRMLELVPGHEASRRRLDQLEGATR